MNGKPKENANPTVLAVDKKDRTLRKRSDWYDALLAISLDPPDTEEYVPPPSRTRTVQDLAILHALADASAASKGKAVSVLRSVGLNIPHSAADIPLQDVLDFSFPKANATAEIRPKAKIKRDPVEADEIFELIRNIQDPEHPLTLEELGVVSRSQVEVKDGEYVKVRFTPTIPHCSMATLIALCIRVKLLRSLPLKYKISIQIEPGTHQSEQSINKQLDDKERVCAALENKHLRGVVNKCIERIHS